MNRKKYFDFIESKLSAHATSLEVRGGLNILDLHLHSENFYQDFFNLLFGWELQNINSEHRNAAGVDLVDSKNNIVVQVSATATKQKVESALAKAPSAYKGHSFKFISISKDAKGLRTKTYLNPKNLIFSPVEDIYDVPSLLVVIGRMGIDQQRQVYEFLKKELRSEPDSEKVESNLSTIIKILSKEDWSQGAPSFETIPYDVEAKITYNRLDAARDLIDEYKIHYPRIDKIYSDFAKQGVNKSLSILNGIRTEYVTLGTAGTSDQRFFSIIEKVIEKIRKSANYTPIPEEELALCVEIIVVDAFIRCKIFKNPLGNSDASS